MTVLHAYTSTRDDLYMLKHWIRHWSQYADRLFVYDDDSTDGSREFMAGCPNVEICDPGFHGIDEILLQDMRRQSYKDHSRGVADWCVIGDSDEFHYHPDFLNALARKKAEGYCAVISHGYQMFADGAPQGDDLLMHMVKDGIEDLRYSRVIFSPEIDMQIGIGHHSFRIFDQSGICTRAYSFNPKGRLLREQPTEENIAKYPICSDDSEFKMLHFKYLGENYIRERHARVYSRLSARNLKNGWGAHSAPEGYRRGYDLSWYFKNRSRTQRVID